MPHPRARAGGRGFDADLRLAAPQLQALGPDFERLAAAVDYDTAHRLRVKIAPAANGSAPRWEVPEDLLPRWGGGGMGAGGWGRRWGGDDRGAQVCVRVWEGGLGCG